MAALASTARSRSQRDLSASGARARCSLSLSLSLSLSDVANNAVIAAGETDDCNQMSVAQPAHCMHLISSVVSVTADSAVEADIQTRQRSQRSRLSSYGNNYFVVQVLQSV